jgi:hypothetical protein
LFRACSPRSLARRRGRRVHHGAAQAHRQCSTIGELAIPADYKSWAKIPVRRPAAGREAGQGNLHRPGRGSHEGRRAFPEGTVFRDGELRSEGECRRHARHRCGRQAREGRPAAHLRDGQGRRLGRHDDPRAAQRHLDLRRLRRRAAKRRRIRPPHDRALPSAAHQQGLRPPLRRVFRVAAEIRGRLY